MSKMVETYEEDRPEAQPRFPRETLVSHWFSDFPKDPGFYWFYGDQYQGQMGCHFRDDSPPIEPSMQLVEIFKVSNGMMGKCEGQFFPTKKFDKSKHRQGYVGYFAKATLPDPPQDNLALFD